MKKLLIIALLLSVLVSCKKPQAFDFRGIDNIHVQQSSLNNTTLSATLTFFNPNSYNVKIKKIDANIFINGNFVSEYRLDSLIVVPANSQFQFPAALNVNTMKVLSGALSSIFNQQAMFHIQGNCKVGRGGFFVNIPFDVTSKQNLRF